MSIVMLEFSALHAAVTFLCPLLVLVYVTNQENVCPDVTYSVVLLLDTVFVNPAVPGFGVPVVMLMLPES